MLPPMTDCVLHHLKAIKLQSVWSHAFEAMQDLGSLEGHGQTKDEELLVPLTITKADTCKPSQADEMLVQDVWLPAKLLLQQHRTCLHSRVLLHGRR